MLTPRAEALETRIEAVNVDEQFPHTLIYMHAFNDGLQPEIWLLESCKVVFSVCTVEWRIQLR